jgi:hypothetical protein
MHRIIIVPVIGVLVLAAACGQAGVGADHAEVPSPPTSAAATTTTATPSPATEFGVMASGRQNPAPLVDAVTESDAQWVRVNVELGREHPDLTAYLTAGLDVVVTVVNTDPSNIDTSLGTTDHYPNAGFPYVSRDTYVADVRALLQPLVPQLHGSRQLIVECENEVGDAMVVPNGRFWRGSTDQYLAVLDACYEATTSVDPAIRVSLSSFASESLDAVLDPSDPHHDFAVDRIERLLHDGRYDMVDLHFYGCVADIAAKVAWVDSRRHAGTEWISTENGGPDLRCPTMTADWRIDGTAWDAAQADEVPVRLDACANAGGRVCLWFSFLDLKNEADQFSHLGLIDTRVRPPRRKPAYDAFAAFMAAAVPKPTSAMARSMSPHVQEHHGAPRAGAAGDA